MTDQRAKSLRWLANQFPAVETPKDDTDRISTCIHLYCVAGADAVDTLTGQLTALQSENVEKDKLLLEITTKYETAVRTQTQITGLQKRVEAERDAAKKCIYDIEAYLAFGSAQYIGRTIQAWKSGAHGEA